MYGAGCLLVNLWRMSVSKCIRLASNDTSCGWHLRVVAGAVCWESTVVKSVADAAIWVIDDRLISGLSLIVLSLAVALMLLTVT